MRTKHLEIFCSHFLTLQRQCRTTIDVQMTNSLLSVNIRVCVATGNPAYSFPGNIGRPLLEGCTPECVCPLTGMVKKKNIFTIEQFNDAYWKIWADFIALIQIKDRAEKLHMSRYKPEAALRRSMVPQLNLFCFKLRNMSESLSCSVSHSANVAH